MLKLVASIFPVQALRGWLWGGTYEFNQTLGNRERICFKVTLGLVRSFYTVVKTVFWLGGWSFFRAPTVLVIFWFLLITRFWQPLRFLANPLRTQTWPERAGAAVASLGCAFFLVGNRRFYSVWGGVGWYVWDWAPWILSRWPIVRFSLSARRVLLPITALTLWLPQTLYFIGFQPLFLTTGREAAYRHERGHVA
mgnify:CR=1 FL=1